MATHQPEAAKVTPLAFPKFASVALYCASETSSAWRTIDKSIQYQEESQKQDYMMPFDEN